MSSRSEQVAREIVNKFIMETKNSAYTVIEGDDAGTLILDIAKAIDDGINRSGCMDRNWWHCWLIHDWGKWELVECTVTTLFSKQKRNSVRQVRMCDKCGKIQVRMVD